MKHFLLIDLKLITLENRFELLLLDTNIWIITFWFLISLIKQHQASNQFQFYLTDVIVSGNIRQKKQQMNSRECIYCLKDHLESSKKFS